MEAIENNKQISFRYYSWTPDKEKKYSNEGKQRVVNPWDLCWDNTAYYCMTSTPEIQQRPEFLGLIKWTKYLLQIKTELLKVLKGLGILILLRYRHLCRLLRRREYLHCHTHSAKNSPLYPLRSFFAVGFKNITRRNVIRSVFFGKYCVLLTVYGSSEQIKILSAL